MAANYDRGLLLYEAKQYKRAEAEFREEVASYPDFSNAHAMLAMCLQGLGKGAKAHQEALEALRLKPDSAYAFYTLSFTLISMKQPQEAERAILQAISIEPSKAYLYGRAAELSFAAKKYEETLSFADQGLAIDPLREDCLVKRANALVQLNRLAEAEQALDAALHIAPENFYAHVDKGAVAFRTGRREEALAHYREALRLKPSSDYVRRAAVQTLKSGNPIYYWWLRMCIWLRRNPRVALFLCLIFIFPIPALRVGFGAFVLLVVFSDMLFTLALQFNPVGRTLLIEPDQSSRKSNRRLSAIICFTAGIAILVGFYCSLQQAHPPAPTKGKEDAQKSKTPVAVAKPKSDPKDKGASSKTKKRAPDQSQ